ncbi:MAG: hypothetical protein V9E82_06400 [Candidatus Nanopelagicales bacterium]
MIGVIRSELLRLTRPRLLITWFALMGLFALMINSVMFSTASSQAQMPATGPGVMFPDAATLAGAGWPSLGCPLPLREVVTLSFWAIAVATDYSTGLVRLLVSAQPHRWKLLAGKTVALALLTALATTVAMVVSVAAAWPSASASGISTDLWGTDLVAQAGSAWLNAYLSMLVWGVAGVVLAVVTRSSAVAISIGVGYVLVVESVLREMLDSASWLLGTTINALAAGGTSDLSYSTALGLSVVYVVIGLAIATVVVNRRDVTD